MNRIVCIDPGLDVTGIAVFKNGFVRSNALGEAMRNLSSIEKIVTPPEMRIASRLAGLRGAVATLLAKQAAASSGLDDDRGVTVLIEEPAIAGVYAEREGRQRGGRALNAAGMAKFYQAFGAIASAIAGYDHHFIRAGQKKEWKRAVVEQAIDRCPPNDGVFPRTKDLRVKKLGQDVVDAIAIGLVWDGWRIR